MKRALHEVYGAARPVGAVCLCNTFGLLIFEPTEEDRADTDFITAWENCEGSRWGFHRNRVHYTTSGRAFLRKGSLRFYLDEIMRV